MHSAEKVTFPFWQVLSPATAFFLQYTMGGTMNKELTELTKRVLASKPERFPKKIWEKIKEKIDLYKADELSAKELDYYLFSKIDFYDSIKKSERWWDTSWTSAGAIVVDRWNCQEYGVKFKQSTPSGTEVFK